MQSLVHLRNAQQGHQALQSLWAEIKPWLIAGHGLEVEVRKERRSTEQNARLWAMLTDVAQQVIWHGKRLSSNDWKCMFTAALKKQEVVPGIDGGFVVVGAYTSRMSKADMAALMDLIEAFGAEHGVKFSAPEYMEQTA